MLNLYGECADHWRRKLAQAGRLSAISAPSTMRAISRRDAMSATVAGPAANAAAGHDGSGGGGGGGAGTGTADAGGLAMNELLLAELDRDLADALSRVEFTEERDDKAVLKEVLPELPQAEILAALSKERMQTLSLIHI